MIANFIPEIWSAQILVNLRAALIYAGFANRQYEGDIAQAGDTVHITDFDEISVRAYTPESPISVDSVDDNDTALLIDQSNYFAFDVDSVIRRQALPGWVENRTQSGAYALATAADTYVSGLMASDTDAGNKLGAVEVNTPNEAYRLLVDLRKKLVDSKVPRGGWFCAVATDFYAMLLEDVRFTDLAASGTTETLRNGMVGRAAGFDIYESTEAPGGTLAIAGSPMACTYAQAILDIHAMERELQFGNLVKGLHLFGAKVVRPVALATADVTVAPS